MDPIPLFSKFGNIDFVRYRTDYDTFWLRECSGYVHGSSLPASDEL